MKKSTSAGIPKIKDQKTTKKVSLYEKFRSTPPHVIDQIIKMVKERPMKIGAEKRAEYRKALFSRALEEASEQLEEYSSILSKIQVGRRSTHLIVTALESLVEESEEKEK